MIYSVGGEREPIYPGHEFYRAIIKNRQIKYVQMAKTRDNGQESTPRNEMPSLARDIAGTKKSCWSRSSKL